MNIVANMAVFSSHRQVFGLPVCDLNWAEAFDFVSALAEMPTGQTSIAFLDAHNANLMLKDPSYRAVLERYLVLPDGIGVDMASLATGGRIFPADLNGRDFVPALMTYMTRPKRVGLLGAGPRTLEKARQNFQAHAPWHEFIAVHDGCFDDGDSARIAAEMERQDLDILLVAMGTPRQEQWAAAHLGPEHARLVITVGALFDVVAGEVPRAPRLLCTLRMEWLFRMLREPKRLSGRYFIGGPVFLGHVVAHAAVHWAGAIARAIGGGKPPRPVRRGSDGI